MAGAVGESWLLEVRASRAPEARLPAPSVCTPCAHPLPAAHLRRRTGGAHIRAVLLRGRQREAEVVLLAGEAGAGAVARPHGRPLGLVGAWRGRVGGRQGGRGRGAGGAVAGERGSRPAAMAERPPAAQPALAIRPADHTSPLRPAIQAGPTVEAGRVAEELRALALELRGVKGGAAGAVGGPRPLAVYRAQGVDREGRPAGAHQRRGWGSGAKWWARPAGGRRRREVACKAAPRDARARTMAGWCRAGPRCRSCSRCWGARLCAREGGSGGWWASDAAARPPSRQRRRVAAAAAGGGSVPCAGGAPRAMRQLHAARLIGEAAASGAGGRAGPLTAWAEQTCWAPLSLPPARPACLELGCWKPRWPRRWRGTERDTALAACAKLWAAPGCCLAACSDVQ